eukprot:scaffold240_cov243-Pinguiococcus_pyrenoidosus.AAC.27
MRNDSAELAIGKQSASRVNPQMVEMAAKAGKPRPTTILAKPRDGRTPDEFAYSHTLLKMGSADRFSDARSF